MQFQKILAVFLISVLCQTAFANATYSQNAHRNCDDPYEPFNRFVFSFNKGVDEGVFKPLAFLYKKIMPKPLFKGIGNMFNNILYVTTIPNDILQAHFADAGKDFTRFFVNSTFGIAGFFDIASKMQLAPHKNDFGLTLARWGVKDSYYVVLPFWGPRTVRDTVAMPIDYYTFSIYPYIHPLWVQYGIYGLGAVQYRAELLQYQSLFSEAAVDEYAFMRDAYLQHRKHIIELNDY